MELYLLRHGDAVEVDPARGITEENRPLSASGEEQMRRMAEGLRRIGFRPRVVLTSPLRRAAQTAAILTAGLEIPPAQERRELRPGCDLALVAELLVEVDEEPRVLLVGHNPDLSRLVCDLTGAEVELHKGGLARVDLPGSLRLRAGTLVWLLTPEVLLQDD